MKNQITEQKLKKELIKQKGITLIALVVTIIVLLILAGVTITLVLGENGIIAKAQKAKVATDEAGAKELVDIAVAGSYGTDARIDLDELNENLRKIKNIEGLDIANLPAIVTVNGYDVTIKEDGTTIIGRMWTKTEEGKITNGTVELSVGDVVNYDHITGATKTTYTSSSSATGWDNDQVFNLSSYTGGWQVLGVENGELLLISSGIIGPDSGGATNSSTGLKYYYLRGQQGYINGVEELNKISAMYGQGKGATGARSINVEDINKITGYDPTSTGTKDGTGTPYQNGQIWEYGNEVTYTRETDSQIAYSGTNGVSGTGSGNQFNYYDETSKAFKAFKALEVGENTRLKSNYYYYYPNTLKESGSGTTVGIDTTSAEYELLFKKTKNAEYYWLGSPYVNTYAGSAYFGVRFVDYGYVNGNDLYYSHGYPYGHYHGVRSVVSLKSDIQLEQDTTSGAWNIK